MKPKLVIRFESLSCSIMAQSLSLINPVGVILPGRVASFAILLYAIANSASMMSRYVNYITSRKFCYRNLLMQGL